MLGAAVTMHMEVHEPCLWYQLENWYRDVVDICFSCPTHHYGETRALPLDAANPAPSCSFSSNGSWVFVSMKSHVPSWQEPETVKLDWLAHILEINGSKLPSLNLPLDLEDVKRVELIQDSPVVDSCGNGKHLYFYNREFLDQVNDHQMLEDACVWLVRGHVCMGVCGCGNSVSEVVSRIQQVMRFVPCFSLLCFSAWCSWFQ
jgi:hypothetical protein